MKDKMYPVVSLKFKDHVHGNSKDTCTCMAWGLLVSQDEEYYYLYQWIAGGDLSDDDNNEVASILRKVVLEIRELGMDTLS